MKLVNSFSLSEQTHDGIVLALSNIIFKGLFISMQILQKECVYSIREGSKVKFESCIILYGTACSAIFVPLSNLQLWSHEKKASHYNERMFLLYQHTVVYLFILLLPLYSTFLCFYSFIYTLKWDMHSNAAEGRTTTGFKVDKLSF